MTTIVPAAAVVLYETLRNWLLDDRLPSPYNYVLVGLVAVVLTGIFSELVFGIVERLEAQSLARSREVATLSAMMGERERLSRELHDGLAQLVAYLLVRIDTVSGLVSAGRTDAAVAELERLRGVADDLYVDVRESISGLRTRVSERGLLPAVREYLEEFEDRHGIAVSLRSDGVPATLPPLAEAQLFRILQEALANVRKHAGAQAACVSLVYREPGVLRMEIADDGKGFDPAVVTGPQGKLYGLATMRERAASVGGAFEVGSKPGAGTRVTVEVPLGDTPSREARDGRAATPAGG
jgi:signal transduction histidine kinase